MQAKDDLRPLLLVDIDGVISLFGFPRDGTHPLRDPATRDTSHARPAGSFHSIDGIPHFLSSTAAEHLLALQALFELVWASGWEEKANEYLPHLLGLKEPLPYLSFDRSPGRSNAHWKLDAIDSYAGERPLAWIDDAFNDACHAWAQAREAPTLLVQTVPAIGLTQREADLLADWARLYSSGSSGTSNSPRPSMKPGSAPPAPIFSSEARSASNSLP